MKYITKRKEIVSTGLLLWDKGLVAGWNGNISLRLSEKMFLVTGRGTCLGRLSLGDMAVMTTGGRHIDGPEPTSERLLHLDIYRQLPAVKAVVHTHTPCINAFFLNNKVFSPKTFEAQYVLGKVHGVDQTAVNVADTAPVVDRLRKGGVVALRRHGVVATGDTLFDGVARIQVLEEQLWMEALGKIFNP